MRNDCQNPFQILVHIALLNYTSFRQQSNKSITIQNKIVEGYDAIITFTDDNSTSALYQLVVNTSQRIPDYQQAYVAGYGEGYVTTKLISMHNRNLLNDTGLSYVNANGTWNQFFIDYTNNQINWLNQQINSGSNKNDSWWHGVDLILNYWLPGMVQGHNENNNLKIDNMSLIDIYLMNFLDDMGDLNYFANHTTFIQQQENNRFDHCTAAIRFLLNEQDVQFAHNSWYSYYSGLLRIAKTYMFHFDFNQTQSQIVTFSSYPGFFFSMDDFYIIHNTDKNGKNNNLAVTETTLVTFNTSLYDEYVDPAGKSVSAWMRTQLSCLFAMTSQQWISSISTAPSYTYNNNYLILDYDVLKNSRCTDCTQAEFKQNILNNDENLLTSYEVIPGHIMYWDATEALLSNGFYLSFNIPENATLYNISGNYDANIKSGNGLYAFENNSRLCIAQRDLINVSNFTQLQQFMLYNDYMNDKCSLKNPQRSIASRVDQVENAKVPQDTWGQTDCKITNFSSSIFQKMAFYVGPTYGGKSNIPQFNEGIFQKAPLGTWTVAPGKWTSVNGCINSDGLICVTDIKEKAIEIEWVLTGFAILLFCLILLWTIVFYFKGGYSSAISRKQRDFEEVTVEEIKIEENSNLLNSRSK